MRGRIILWLLSTPLFAATLYAAPGDTVIPYSLPSEYAISTTFSVSVNGVSVPAYKDGVRSYVQFEFSGKADVRVTVSENVTKYSLVPKSYKIQSTVSGKEISFSLTEPRKMALFQVNALPERLFIIAEPLEYDKPDLSDPNVVKLCGADIAGALSSLGAGKTLYVPSGTYSAGQLSMVSNSSLYLEPGVLLKGTLQCNNVENVKIYGRGTVDGSMGSGQYILAIDLSKNILVQDILFQKWKKGFHVHMVGSEKVTLYNVKLVGETADAGNDGIDPNAVCDLTIDNCFVYSGDDCHSLGVYPYARFPTLIKSIERINMINCVLWNNASGAGIKYGLLEGEWVRDLNYENIDVVRAPRGISINGIGSCIVQNNYFKGVRIEHIDARVIDLTQRTGYAWGGWSSGKLNQYKDFYFINCSAEEAGKGNSNVGGVSAEYTIENVIFDNYKLKGNVCLSAQDAGINIKTNTKNIQFVNTHIPEIGIKAKELYAYENGLKGTSFIVKRTGNTEKELSITYTIRGSAKNGIDYQALSGTVVLPAGQSSAEIPIKIKKDMDEKEGPETIFISLNNRPFSSDYTIGPDFHAVVTILD